MIKKKIKENVKETRKKLFNTCDTLTVIRKGDKRPTHNTRLCAICGRKLTNMSLVNGNVITVYDHYTIDYGGFLKYYICYDIKSCYSNLHKLGE